MQSNILNEHSFRYVPPSKTRNEAEHLWITVRTIEGRFYIGRKCPFRTERDVFVQNADGFNVSQCASNILGWKRDGMKRSLIALLEYRRLADFVNGVLQSADYGSHRHQPRIQLTSQRYSSISPPDLSQNFTEFSRHFCYDRFGCF